MSSYSYVYEVRHGTELVATGRLTREDAVQIGERMTVGHHTGLVRSVQPGLSDQVPRVVIELLPG